MRHEYLKTVMQFRYLSFVLAVASCLLFASLPCISPAAGQDEDTEKVEKKTRKLEIREISINAPKSLNRGPNLLTIWVKDEKRWRQAKPDEFKLEVDGAAKILPDVCKEPVNPVTLVPDDDGTVTVKAFALEGDAETEKKFNVAALEAKQTLSIDVDPTKPSHPYSGMGAGAMFYDNQFTIDNQLFDWCFKDVETQFLHVLIRPDFELENDNDDWQDLDDEAFDWEKCQRLFWITWHAKNRNPDLKIYACLYSPPAWMKANDATTGEAGLKEGENYRLEMAEYVYAFLKHAEWKGTVIDYLCLFNEPDFPHQQDGNYIESLTELAQTHKFVSEKVIELIDADPDFDHKPKFVFPETLGPGSITRAKEESKKLTTLTEEGLLDDLTAWGVHDYWNSGGGYWNKRYKELREFPGVGDKPIWMTEWAQRHSRGDLASAQEYGQKILNALRLGASAWMAFEWAHPAPNQSGLISTQWGEGFPKKRFWRSKSYYVFKQIANTSPAGGEVLEMKLKVNGKAPGEKIESLAIKKDDKLVVHLLNTHNRPLRFKLNIKGDESFKLKAVRQTAASSNDELIKDDVVDKNNAGELRPYSLLTLQFSAN